MAEPKRKPAPRWVPRLIRTVITTVVTAFAAAIALAVLDLYLTGHGHPSIARAWIAWPAVGVHLSRADVLVLLAAGGGGFLQWRRGATRP
ncbi:MAG: hypothetical protein OEW06_07200 [Gemmatimonadota bacterium]|nr:hypothetical protein [Gemmatimonadota bacterium]